jgi:hypothetical protein
LTPEIIVEIFTSGSLFLASYIMSIKPKIKKVHSLFFIRLALIFMGLLFTLDLIANMFLDIFLTRIAGLMLFPAAIFFIIGVNYILKESYNSILLVIIFSVGCLFCYVAFLPDSVGFEIDMGFLAVNWIGLYKIMGFMFICFMGSISFYWGLKTWINAPFLIKKEASIFLLGVLINGPVTLTIFLFSIWNPTLIILAYASTGIGTFTFCLIMSEEPKLLYILPFTLYRIIVKDREGYLLFDHDWSSTNVKDSVFTGFLNAVQLMSEEIMKMGGLLDINLEEGILILNKSETISVGLLSSKTSKLLRVLVVNFSKAFQERFSKELKEYCKERSRYNAAYELIEQYFSNFPSKIITSKKKPLLLSEKLSNVPLSLLEKLKTLLSNEEEYKSIEKELQKAPIGLSSEFLSLYDELKNDMEQISNEDLESLEDKSNKKV